MAERIAIVDLGSNAVRLLLARVSRGVGFEILRETRAPTRLGGQPGRLPARAVHETVEASGEFLDAVVEASTREPAHVVGAHDDAREIPDHIRHASFEPEDVPFGGPTGMLPPNVPEDADHRHPAIDGTPDPIPDLPQHRVSRLLIRDGVKTIAPLELVRSEPAALEAGHVLHHLVRDGTIRDAA